MADKRHQVRRLVDREHRQIHIYLALSLIRYQELAKKGITSDQLIIPTSDILELFEILDPKKKIYIWWSQLSRLTDELVRPALIEQYPQLLTLKLDAVTAENIHESMADLGVECFGNEWLALKPIKRKRKKKAKK